MIAINKRIVYECVCRTQNEEVKPQDYGFAEGDYKALYDAVVMCGQELYKKNEDGTDYFNEDGNRVWLSDECYVDNSKQLAQQWSVGYLSVTAFIEYLRSVNVDVIEWVGYGK